MNSIKTAHGRNKRKTSPVHRLGLTHGPAGGIPKIIRENSEQFFALASRRKSKILSASRPIVSNEFLQQNQRKQYNNNNNNSNNNVEKEKNLLSKSNTRPLTPIMVLPPIGTANSKKSKSISSASFCAHPTNFTHHVPSRSSSLESLTPAIRTPSPTLTKKRHIQHNGRVDPDIFRKAYERALSVARSRLLFHDPYSLTRASATHGILYSYYDHTPMCIFSRGTACNHKQDKHYDQGRKSKGNIPRKKIFNDVVVENYIQ